jgi:serine/threonine-protein kinase
MIDSNDGEIALMKTAVACGFLSMDQVDECLGIQEKTEERLPLIAVRKGYLTQGQLLALVSGKTEPFPPIPGFQIEARLRRGGMGTVYKARENGSGRLVALKVLNRNVSRQQRLTQRFIKEAATNGRVEHPNVVAAYEVAHAGSVTFYVMEFIHGIPVDEMILKQNRLDERKALDITRQVALALGALNRENLVHCDVKPSNVIVAPDGLVKLCDLGVARFQDGKTVRINGVRAVVGTPSYMSPEQVEGKKDLDIRSDLYSLGTVLFTMLIGRPPFIGKNAAGTMQKHLSAPVPDVKSLRPDLSDATADIVTRLMQKSPDDRFQSPEDLIEALDPALGRSKRATPGRSAFRWVAAAASILVLASAGLIYQLNSEAMRSRPGSFVPIVRDEIDPAYVRSLFERAEQLMASDRWVDASPLLESLVTEYRFGEAHDLLIRARRELEALRDVAELDSMDDVDARLAALNRLPVYTRVFRLNEPRLQALRHRLVRQKESLDHLRALRSAVERAEWVEADEHLAYLRSSNAHEAETESLGIQVDRRRSDDIEGRVGQILSLADADYTQGRWETSRALYLLARNRYGASVRDRLASIEERVAACEQEIARELEERAADAVVSAERYAEQEDWSRALAWIDHVLFEFPEARLVQSRCREFESMRSECVKRLRQGS